MTLVLSMNPFLDSAVWESDRCSKTRRSDPEPPCSPEQLHAPEPAGRKVPDPVSMSRIAYFKRKFVHDDDEVPFSFRTYCQTVAPVLEERAHVLRLSLEKMRFMEDPEAFLRRSVLVNNLLRRLRAEILLQSNDWCFPPNPALAGAPCVPPPGIVHRAAPARVCLPPPAGPSLRKRLRTFGPGQELRPRCAQTCCCIYAAAGRYLHLPFSVYDAALSSCPSTPGTSLLHLAGRGKLDPAVDDEEEEPRGESSSAAPQDGLRQTSRTKDMRTEDSCMAECVEGEEDGPGSVELRHNN